MKRTHKALEKNQNIHINKQYRETAQGAGLAAKHHPGATADSELLCDNLVILFFFFFFLSLRQMQTVPLSKILASLTLQAAVMRHFRVESETQQGQPQPGPWASTWCVWGCPLSPPQYFFPQATLALSGFFLGVAVEVKALCEEKWELPQAGFVCCWSSRYPCWGIQVHINNTSTLGKALH